MQFGKKGAAGALSVFLVLAWTPIAQAQLDGRSRFTPQAPAVEQPGRREWTWQGGNALAYGGPDRLRYEPGGSPRIIVTGDPAIVETIEVSGGEIRRRNTQGFSNFVQPNPQVEILVRGVTLDHFRLSGSGSTELGRMQRDRLDLQVNGSGSVSAQGRARRLNVQVDGSGRANLGQLSAGEADITIAGSGSADIGDVDRDLSIVITGSGQANACNAGKLNVVLTGSGGANLNKVDTVTARLAGSGGVRLGSHPRKANYDIRGSGLVVMVGPDGKRTELARSRQPDR
jgi:hypothetical protein